jgi:hypothetical protein
VNAPEKYEELEERISAAIAAADPALFDSLALEVFHFQRACNPAYREYCRLIGLTTEPNHWRQIPALYQTAFKQAPLRTFPAEEETAQFHTSGTTGETRGIHHFRSLRLYDEAILRGWDLLNLPALPQLLLIPHPSVAPHSSLAHMMGVLKSRALNGEQHWCIGDANCVHHDQFKDTIEAFTAKKQPILLLGTALAFHNWFETAGTYPKSAIIPLPAGSLALETGGYKGIRRTTEKKHLFFLFDRCLSLPADSIINEYGMTELSSQCYTRGLGHPHIAPPWTRVVVIDPATGEEVPDNTNGLLRIYDLANLGSVMAIQTRDVAIRRGEHFELLGRDPAALPRGCSRAAEITFR